VTKWKGRTSAQVDKSSHRPCEKPRVVPSTKFTGCIMVWWIGPTIDRVDRGPNIRSYHRPGRRVVPSTKWMGRTIDHVPLAVSMCRIIGIVDWSYYRLSRQAVPSTKCIARTIDKVHTIGRVNGSSTKCIGTIDYVHRSEHRPSKWIVSSASRLVIPSAESIGRTIS
jgi:hypothetical protein